MVNGQKQVGFVIAVLMLMVLIGFLWTKKDVNSAEDKKEMRQVSDFLNTNNIRSAIESKTKEEFNTKLREAYNRINPLYVCGKAVDTDGNPLPGVEVKIWWETVGFLIGLPREHNQYKWLTSDGGGEWMFDVKKPSRVYVEDARKEGYVFEKIRSTCGDLAYIRETNKTESVEAIVCMRKRKEEVFLLKYPKGQIEKKLLIWSKGGRNKSITLDILSQIEGGRNVTLYKDLQINAAFDSSNQCWTIMFNTLENGDGINSKNVLLFEAPEADYEKDIIIKAKTSERVFNDKNYFYLRSRKQGLYTRVFYYYDAWNDDRTGPNLRVYLGTATNPYGERSLEYAKILEEKYSFAEDEMIEEAKQAIQAGKLPKKPVNLEAHLEERERAIRKAKNIPMR